MPLEECHEHGVKALVVYEVPGDSYDPLGWQCPICHEIEGLKSAVDKLKIALELVITAKLREAYKTMDATIAQVESTRLSGAEQVERLVPEEDDIPWDKQEEGDK